MNMSEKDSRMTSRAMFVSYLVVVVVVVVVVVMVVVVVIVL